MWQQLFANACILITMIFIVSQLLFIGVSGSNNKIKFRVLLGAMGGISTIILFYFSIQLTPQVKMDFRDISIILVALFGGWTSAIITCIMTAAFRLLNNGVSSTIILLCIGIMATGIGCGLISLTHLRYKWMSIIMLLYSLMIRSIVYYIVLKDNSSFLNIILTTWASTILIVYGVFHFVRYLLTSYRLLRNLQIESTEDYLTGLSNKRYFNQELASIMKEMNEKPGRVSLLILDIDNFKEVNDTYGHAAGDAVLKELGKVLSVLCEGNYVISRVGGEEFAVVLKDEPPETTLETAERIRKAVTTHRFPIQNGDKLKISVSIGAAVYPDTVEDLDKLTDEADNKLYVAKRTGKNKVCI
jgi:diguanylate cyclase